MKHKNISTKKKHVLIEHKKFLNKKYLNWQKIFRSSDLSSYGVLLHERLLGEVELERVVRGQRDVEAAHEVVIQRRAGVLQEQRVVGQRRHRDTHLPQAE